MKDKLKYLIAGVLITVSIIGLFYGAVKLKDKIYRQGANDGAAYVVNEILKFAVDCEQMPIKAGNVTINLIPIECLNANCFKPECLR